jgi:hypothetical protein
VVEYREIGKGIGGTVQDREIGRGEYVVQYREIGRGE